MNENIHKIFNLVIYIIFYRINQYIKKSLAHLAKFMKYSNQQKALTKAIFHI